MPLTGVLALIDGVVAVALLLSVPGQRRNKVAVLAVAAVLLGVSGWLAILALTPNGSSAAPSPQVSESVRKGPTA